MATETLEADGGEVGEGAVSAEVTIGAGKTLAVIVVVGEDVLLVTVEVVPSEDVGVAVGGWAESGEDDG